MNIWYCVRKLSCISDHVTCIQTFILGCGCSEINIASAANARRSKCYSGGSFTTSRHSIVWAGQFIYRSLHRQENVNYDSSVKSSEQIVRWRFDIKTHASFAGGSCDVSRILVKRWQHDRPPLCHRIRVSAWVCCEFLFLRDEIPANERQKILVTRVDFPTECAAKSQREKLQVVWPRRWRSESLDLRAD
jgi:hypothetical protein